MNNKRLITAPMRPPGFSYRALSKGNVLFCEDVDLSHIAKKYGTPVYVYSAGMIRERCRIFERAFSAIPHLICYSVKANSNLSILRLLARERCGFDVVSGGELERVLAADQKSAKKVVFSGVGKTREELIAALRAGILLFNVESESELQVLAECAERSGKKASLALRVNPDVAAETHPYISTGLHKHKFGVPISEARKLYAEAARSRYLLVRGVSVHIGSQIRDVSPFGEALARVAELVQQLRSDGHAIQYVDAGGGLGISYQEAEPDFSGQVEAYARALIGSLKGVAVRLLLEPGRSIVGPAGVLATTVIYKKINSGKRFLIVDAAMNDLIRPALYNAHHEIVPLVASNGKSQETVDIVGPICETGDFFARDRDMAQVNEGDLLAILDAGAYGMVLASNYNTRPRPAEVLIRGKSARLIRKREKIADLLKREL